MRCDNSRTALSLMIDVLVKFSTKTVRNEKPSTRKAVRSSFFLHQIYFNEIAILHQISTVLIISYYLIATTHPY